MQRRWNELAEHKRRWLLTIGVHLLLAPFFEPTYVTLCAPAARVFYNAGEVLSTLIVSGIFLWNVVQKKRLSGAMIALFALEGWMSVDVLIHQGVSKPAFLGIVSVLVVGMLIETMMSREHAAELLNAFLLLYEILIGLNFLTMLIWPKGLYHTPNEGWLNWFLGYKNMFLFYYAPALSLEFLNLHRTGKAARMNIMVLVCTVSMIIGGSTTGIISILVFDVLYISRMYRTRICSILPISLVALAANAVVVFVDLKRVLTPFLQFVGKEFSFYERIRIWDKMIELIRQHPVLGYGLQSDEVRGEISGLWTAVKSHNFLIEQQYCFGIIGTVLFLAFLGVLIVGLHRNRTHPYAASLCLGMICYYLLMMMESHINQIPMMSFLFIACFAGQMIEQLKMKTA